ncbi:MAG: hypothetical protein JNM18_11195 [Planctomycetaceae bacterium]|nr:hypothetical protein [Planctomycetaceae bacterium]
MRPLSAECHIALAQLAENCKEHLAIAPLPEPEKGFARLQVAGGVGYLARCYEQGFLTLEELELAAAWPAPKGLSFAWTRVLSRNDARWPVFAADDSADFSA